MDRLGRDALAALTVARDLDARGARIVITTLGVDGSTPAGRTVFGVLAQLAELERATLIERTNPGLAAAKKRGRRFGRRHSLTPHAERGLVAYLRGEAAAVFDRPDLWPVHGRG